MFGHPFSRWRTDASLSPARRPPLLRESTPELTHPLSPVYPIARSPTQFSCPLLSPGYTLRSRFDPW